MNIEASVNDAVNAENELNVLSGALTISSGDDALHSDMTLNIGKDGSDGPDITITNCNEGLEGATVNVHSGDIDIVSTDDCINGANADLPDYAYQINISGGTVLAAGSSSGMGVNLEATQPCVVYSNVGTMGMQDVPTNEGNVLYEGNAVCNASYVFFSSSDITSGTTYTLTSGDTTVDSEGSLER